MHCSHLLIAFQEIQNFSNRSKFICSEDSALLSPAPQRLLPPFPPAQPRVTDTCRVRQETEGTEHRDSTWLQGSVRAAARISTGHDPGQREAGRGWAPAAASPTSFYSLICLENGTFNSVGIPGPAAATSYLLEDSDNPTGCVWEGRGQEEFFSGTCHSVPSIASNGSSQRQSQNQ